MAEETHDQFFIKRGRQFCRDADAAIDRFGRSGSEADRAEAIHHLKQVLSVMQNLETKGGVFRDPWQSGSPASWDDAIAVISRVGGRDLSGLTAMKEINDAFWDAMNASMKRQAESKSEDATRDLIHVIEAGPVLRLIEPVIAMSAREAAITRHAEAAEGEGR